MLTDLFRVIAATICRLVFLSKLPPGRAQVFALWTVVVCTQVEIFMTIFTASIPYVKPFFDGVEVSFQLCLYDLSFLNCQQSGLWRSDELRRRNLTIADLYGIGSSKTDQYIMGTTVRNANSNELSRSGVSKKGVKHRDHGLPTKLSDEIISWRDEDDWSSHNSAGSRSRIFH